MCHKVILLGGEWIGSILVREDRWNSPWQKQPILLMLAVTLIVIPGWLSHLGVPIVIMIRSPKTANW